MVGQRFFLCYDGGRCVECHIATQHTTIIMNSWRISISYKGNLICSGKVMNGIIIYDKCLHKMLTIVMETEDWPDKYHVRICDFSVHFVYVYVYIVDFIM